MPKNEHGDGPNTQRNCRKERPHPRFSDMESACPAGQCHCAARSPSQPRVTRIAVDRSLLRYLLTIRRPSINYLLAAKGACPQKTCHDLAQSIKLRMLGCWTFGLGAAESCWPPILSALIRGIRGICVPDRTSPKTVSRGKQNKREKTKISTALSLCR